jgi:hypothetical protein
MALVAPCVLPGPLGPAQVTSSGNSTIAVKVPNGYCPNHRTGVKLPEGFAVTPLAYVD